jgi:hypothetical protein
VPPLLREGACAPAEGTESEEPQLLTVRTNSCDRAPARRVSSTRGRRCVRVGPGEDHRCVPTEARLLATSPRREDALYRAGVPSIVRIVRETKIAPRCLERPASFSRERGLAAWRHAGAPAPFLPFPEKHLERRSLPLAGFDRAL